MRVQILRGGQIIKLNIEKHMKAELVLGNLKRERDALNNKLERLEQALSKEWQDEDQEYLCSQQYNAMSLYAHILDERILDIEYKLEKKKAESKCNVHETCHNEENIFKEKIDLGSFKEECDNIKSSMTIAELLKDVFGVVICDE